MKEPPSEEKRFYSEVLKLLLQVILSDEQITPEELRHMAETAQRWNLPPAEVEALLEGLRRGERLPAPDMGLLRARPEFVLEAARSLIESDQHIAASELEVLQQIRDLLGP